METLEQLFAGLEVRPSEAQAEPARKPAVEPGRIADAFTAKRFIQAGKATFTLRSRKTGARFTYRVTANEDKTCFFVGVLTGSDNETAYSYLGRISRDVFWHGRKVPKPGDVGKDAPSAKAFDWAWRQLVRGQLPESLEVWHEGKCGRCSRTLTVPESIRTGFGPECREYLI